MVSSELDYSNQLLCCLYLSMNHQSNTYYYQNQIRFFIYIYVFFNFSKLLSFNTFSETNISLSIIFLSHVIIMFLYHTMLHLKIVEDKIYCHLQ